MTGLPANVNLRGAAFMTGSMFAFAVMDVLMKTLGQRLPGGQIITVVGAGAAIAFAVWFLIKGQPVFVPAHLNGRVWLRALFEVLGTLFFVSALLRLDVTMLSAIVQATPLVVAIGGFLFFGQKTGWRRGLAILVGFGGVLLIIRPGTDAFSIATLLGIGGMLGLAGRDLATRAITVPISGAHLSLHAFLALIPAGVLLCVINDTPFVAVRLSDSLVLGLTIAASVLAYLLVIAATRAGDAGFISSFRYTRMLFALILGMVILGERPDKWTLIGAGIVIAAGVFTLLREARARRTSNATTETV